MKATKLYSAIDLHSNNLFVAIGDAQADALNMADYFAWSMRSRNSFVRINPGLSQSPWKATSTGIGWSMAWRTSTKPSLLSSIWTRVRR
jgi:hypothetical protein